jgi:hypothetical protein
MVECSDLVLINNMCVLLVDAQQATLFVNEWQRQAAAGQVAIDITAIGSAHCRSGMVIIETHMNAILRLHFRSINPTRPEHTVGTHCRSCGTVAMFHKIVPGTVIAVCHTFLNPWMQAEPMALFAPAFNEARRRVA